MNKTVSVNLNGLLFNIEEMGYERLLRYLNKIKIYFENSTGSDEIINDIEGRIAELFQERLADGRQVITEKDVDEVMGIMGKPEDFASEFDEESQPNYESNYESGNKKLFRDPDDSILGGVCSGIAYYFGVERVVLRLIFALAFVFAGSGLLLYIILWIVMPVAKTTADKLRMKGEPVNVGNIERRFKEDLKKMGKAVEDVAKEAEDKFKKAKAGDKISGFVSDLIEGVGKFIKVVFNVVGKFIGLIFLMLGLGLFFGAITFAFGSGFIFSGGNMALSEPFDNGIIYDANQTLGITENNEASLIVLYPNPCQNELNLKMASYNYSTKYEIFNSFGQLVQSGVIEPNNLSINTSDFAEGFYIISINGNEHQRFQVVR
jgi:phage shock protein PspC (stress-responsive transcriptional regulator)